MKFNSDNSCEFEENHEINPSDKETDFEGINKDPLSIEVCDFDKILFHDIKKEIDSDDSYHENSDDIKLNDDKDEKNWGIKTFKVKEEVNRENTDINVKEEIDCDNFDIEIKEKIVVEDVKKSLKTKIIFKNKIKNRVIVDNKNTNIEEEFSNYYIEILYLLMILILCFLLLRKKTSLN